jgi:ABC-type transporter Mla subunit MlaD
MSDARSADAEHLLGLVARGVQRMADSFGALERTVSSMPATRPVWVDELVERLVLVERRVAAQGELVTSLHDVVSAIRATPVGAAVEIPDDRLAGVERVLASLRDELAIDRLETSLRDVAEDTSGLRADVRRSFERVLHEISTTEASLKGEVRAIDQRLTGFGEDLRLVRGLRDGLEALAAGVDSVRQLAARSATSSQMGELATDLSTVLAEIESARAHVLSVDQTVGRAQASTIDVAAAGSGDVARTVEELERTVTEEMSELGARIEQLAERAVAATPEPVEDPIARRLRSLATSARQLGLGITEDFRSRRAARPLKARRS